MFLVPFSVRWLGLGSVGVGSIGAILATSVWVLLREIRRRLGRGTFPSANFVLRIGLAFAATTAVGKLVSYMGRTPDVGAAVLHLFLGALTGSAVYSAAALALRLVPLETAFSAGRWLKQRFEAPSP